MTTETTDLERIAREVDLPGVKTARTLALLDEGNTIAFITRYRKDQTGGLDEEQIRKIQSAAIKNRQLNERKEAIVKSIEAQNRMTAELRMSIDQAESAKQLEDLYLPYKPKKQSLATLARQRGLAPLAEEILSAAPEATDYERRALAFVSDARDLPTVEHVLQGVRHLLAERFNERADIRVKLRPILMNTGHLISTRVEPSGSSAGDSEAPERDRADTPPGNDQAPDGGFPERTGSSGRDFASTQTPPKAKRKKKRRTANPDAAYQDYFDYREPISRVPPHRILAINRGERAKVLRLRIEGDTEQMFGVAAKLFVPPEHPHARFLRDCVRDTLNRTILPSLEREVRRELTERAEQHAVKVFAHNLRNLLLQPPIRGRRILAVDPGFRSGCKLAALDEFGNLLEYGLIYIVGSDQLLRKGRDQLASLVRRHRLTLIAIGNGTAGRETESFVADVIDGDLADSEISYLVVNEAGASVYSTSPLGREELPDFDPVVRSTISIGRRLLDPLSELVKINPANIGVGMYQHDVKAKPLRESLDAVVESCVNFVGVDVNTASPALLSYVSGLNQLTARRVYEHRLAHGPFRNRRQLKDVPGIGEATFVQSAGFLKITDGDNPLDATWIHPESYNVAIRLLSRLDSSVAELSATRKAASPRRDGEDQSAALSDRASGLNLAALADELEVGELLLNDLLVCLTRPGRDPRDDLTPPVFRSGIMKLDDLKPGMELRGTVVNVVDFGAFVDIGVSDSALVHISQLANRYVLDPHDVVSVGDVVTVWVVSIDKERRRVSLTAVPPGVGKSAEETSDTKSAGPRNRADPPARATSAKRSSGARHGGPSARKFRREAKRETTLTEAMVDGTEPLRSFSDLLQFYEHKKTSDDAEQQE